MNKGSIEDMNAKIKECYGVTDAKDSTTAAKIRAMRDARKTYEAIYKKEVAALNEKSAGATPNETYVIPPEKLNEIVDCMIRFGILRNVK